jgi:hypothetical protein
MVEPNMPFHRTMISSPDFKDALTERAFLEYHSQGRAWLREVWFLSLPLRG